MFGVRKASKEFAVALREILDENSRLKAENEKLKKAAERDADVLESLNLSLEESQAENAKLRELMKHYANEVYEIGCLGCPYFDEYPDKCEPYKLYPYTDGCRLLDDMRGLKIEVPHD